MNAWFQVLDKDTAGMEGSILVTEWNDEVMLVLCDGRGEWVARVWLGADQVFAIEDVFRHVFGPQEAE